MIQYDCITSVHVVYTRTGDPMSVKKNCLFTRVYKNETAKPDTVSYRHTNDYVTSGGKCKLLLHHGGVGVAGLSQLFE